VESVNEVKSKTVDLLNRVSADDCFEQWKIRMQRCINMVGQYVEGDRN
jgi:hypothetical protein